MKKSFYSGLVILLLTCVSATAALSPERPIKLPPPPTSPSSTTLNSSVPLSFWLWMCTGVGR
jgi:hypothetical protein